MTGFVQSDPLGAYRWVDAAGPFRHLAETVGAYGGRNLKLSEQLPSPALEDLCGDRTGCGRAMRTSLLTVAASCSAR